MFRHLITSQGLPAEGDEKYTSDGSYTFTVPAGVTSISAVLIGGGGGSSANFFGTTVEGGAGGTLVYATLLVTPGESLSVVVGDGGDAGAYNRPVLGVRMGGQPRSLEAGRLITCARRQRRRQLHLY